MNAVHVMLYLHVIEITHVIDRYLCVCVFCCYWVQGTAVHAMWCIIAKLSYARLELFRELFDLLYAFFRKKAHIATDTTSKERRRDTRRTNLCSAERGRNLWWMTLQYKRTSSIVARMQILSEYCIWFSVNTHQVATWQHGNRSIQWIL